jgi:hypothetical protein
VSLRADNVEVPVAGDGFPLIERHIAPNPDPIPRWKNTVKLLPYRQAVVATIYAKTAILYAGYSALILEDAYLKIGNNAAGPGIRLTDDLRFIITHTEPSG